MGYMESGICGSYFTMDIWLRMGLLCKFSFCKARVAGGKLKDVGNSLWALSLSEQW